MEVGHPPVPSAQAKPPTPNSGPVSGASYFVDQKKGEVNELKTALKNLTLERDVRRKREIIKKVRH
jgi:AP-4 complex subunit beta-1